MITVTIRIDPREEEDVLVLTRTQINKIKFEKNKGVDITLS